MKTDIMLRLSRKELEELGQLSSDCYSENFHEGIENWLSKAFIWPSLSIYAKEDELIGYVISFPYNSKKEVVLKAKIKEIPENVDCIYIHDIGVKKSHRGQGIAKKLLQIVFQEAKHHIRCKKFFLTSVQNTVKFWEKFGFKTVSVTEYGGEKAFKMERPIEEKVPKKNI